LQDAFGGVDDCSDKLPQVRDSIPFQALAVPEPEALAALYADQNLSTREVAAALACGATTVKLALARTGIAPRTRREHAVQNQPGTYHVGQLPYGAKLVDAAVAEHAGERRVVATMRKLRAGGASYDVIAQHLNDRGHKTKNGKTWHHTTIARIIRRSD